MSRMKVAPIAATLAILAAAPVAAQGRGHGKEKPKDSHHAAIQQRQAEHQREVQYKQMSHISDKEMRDRIKAQQQRDREYQKVLEQRTRYLQQQAAALQRANRAAQYRYQQQYIANLRAQQARIASRNYSNDPYYYSPNNYRYVRSGAAYQTNQYGVEALKRALNYGYEEGVRAGQADRQDGYRGNYTSSFAYQDANYGYDGRYISQADYNYYFREGFRRGYQDGYNSASRYGSYNNGTGSILGTLVNNILGLQLIQ